jgi:hypothetical protein
MKTAAYQRPLLSSPIKATRKQVPVRDPILCHRENGCSNVTDFVTQQIAAQSVDEMQSSALLAVDWLASAEFRRAARGNIPDTEC